MPFASWGVLARFILLGFSEVKMTENRGITLNMALLLAVSPFILSP
jgi:hypothetical protein